MTNKKNNILVWLFLGVVGVLVIPFIYSCGKEATVLPTGSNIQMQVLNLSTDLLPVDLYIKTVKKINTLLATQIRKGIFRW